MLTYIVWGWAVINAVLLIYIFIDWIWSYDDRFSVDFTEKLHRTTSWTSLGIWPFLRFISRNLSVGCRTLVDRKFREDRIRQKASAGILEAEADFIASLPETRLLEDLYSSIHELHSRMNSTSSIPGQSGIERVKQVNKTLRDLQSAVTKTCEAIEIAKRLRRASDSFVLDACAEQIELANQLNQARVEQAKFLDSASKELRSAK